VTILQPGISAIGFAELAMVMRLKEVLCFKSFSNDVRLSRVISIFSITSYGELSSGLCDLRDSTCSNVPLEF